MSRPAPVAQQIRAQAGMELRLLLRNGESLLVSFGIPLGVLVFLARVVRPDLGDGGDPLDTLVPGVLALSVMSTAFVAQAIQTGFQRKYAVLKRLGATPLSRTSFLVAKSLAVLVIVAIQTVAVLAVAYALGWTWPANASAVLLVAALVGGTAMFTALGLLLAGVLKAELTLALANAIYLVLAAIGGLALAPDGAGSGAVQVAVATPSGALALLMGEALPRPGDDVGLALLAGGVVLAWLTAGVALAARWFRWEP
jgi:ABC-2 type transport system permease protein